MTDIDKYNPKNRETLIAFDNIIAGMLSNK